MPYYIYKLNFPSPNSYIGKTYDPAERLKAHKRDSRNGCMYTVHCAIRKHGSDNLTQEILFQTNCEWFAYKMEILLIKYYDTYRNGYNMTPGGDRGGNTNIPCSPEKRKAIGNANRGKRRTQAEKDQISKNSARWWHYHKMPESQIENMRIAQKGNSNGGKKFTATNTETGQIYREYNMASFCREHNIKDIGAFRRVAKGGRSNKIHPWAVTLIP